MYTSKGQAKHHLLKTKQNKKTQKLQILVLLHTHSYTEQSKEDEVIQLNISPGVHG